MPPSPSISAFKANLERFKHVIPSTTSERPPQENTKKRHRDEEARPDNPPSPSPAKKKTKKNRPPNQYAPPSQYAHLAPLTDILAPNLICVFVGFNPGVKTATDGHAYSHPSNSFWKLLHSSGCTDVRLPPERDGDLPRLYAMGNTNIVARPSRNAAELSKAESAAGTPVLEEKIRRWRPEAVCIVGKGIWESVWRWRYGRGMRKGEFRYGWQDGRERMGVSDDWAGADVFVATATSGLAANLSMAEKEAIWAPFGQWVRRRREERGLVGGSGGEGQSVDAEDL
jgi:TDG/mug DNA glycosylase family protein